MRVPCAHALAVLACIAAAAPCTARDGDIDLGFGSFGKAIFQPPGGLYLGAYNTELALQPTTGKILVAAPVIPAGGGTDFGVMRVNEDGAVDGSFGSSGARIVPFNRTAATSLDDLGGMTVQPDGKILLVGIVAGDVSTGTDIGVVRLTESGNLDGTFGSGTGKVVVPFNVGAAGALDDQAIRINLQADGKILLAGSAELSGSPTYLTDMAIARLNTNGIRDSSFDTDGRVTVNFGANGAVAFRVKQLADGKLLAVGTYYTGAGNTNADYALVKLDENGAPDTAFGASDGSADGKITYAFDVGGSKDDVATDFVENPDGSLMVCGESKANDPNNFDISCERFLADGTPDPAFTPVLVIFDLGADLQDVPLRMERDGQGRYVIAGFAQRATGNFDAAVARLLPGGQLDPSFGNGGQRTFGSAPFLGTDMDNGASGLGIQPDGKILLAGHAASSNPQPGNYTDYKFEVIRVMGDTLFENGFELP